MIHVFTNMRYHRAWGMLLVRLAAGLVFLMHGWGKLADIAGAEGFFSSLGLPPGTGVFIALVETIGGLMLITGVAPRLAGLILGVEMIVALIMVGIPMNSFELEFVLAACALAVWLCGGGRYAVYGMESRDS